MLKSPGLAPGDPRIAPLMAQRAKRGIAVQGELDLFVRALADLKLERGYAPQVVAITGTNGKTTTTAMTAQLIERTGKHVAMAGNIGPTMLATLAQMLDDEAVLGICPMSGCSSCRASSSTPCRASSRTLRRCSTSRRITSTGTATMQAYAAAKARVFGEHAVMVINRDDPAVAAMVPEPTPPKVPGKRTARRKPRKIISFGLTAPRSSR